MSDDPWLRELAQVKRDEDAEERSLLDERWDRLSAGELSPEEEAGLRALAETSEEAREAYEAFRPLGPDFHARVVNAVRAERKAAEPRPRILPFRPSARLGGWLTAAATAAAVLMVVLRSPAPLPDYAPPEVTGGSKAERGGEPQSGTFSPGDPIRVVLRPETAVSGAGPLEARCVLVRGGDRLLRLLETRTEIDPDGSVKMDGVLDADVPPGAWTLWAVAGRPGRLPEPAELRNLSAVKVRRDGWTAMPTAIRIEAGASP